MAFWDGVSDLSAYAMQSVMQQRQLFQQYANRMDTFMRMVQPAAKGRNVSAMLRGTVQTEMEDHAVRMTEYVSPLIALIHANYVGRATRIPPRIKCAVPSTEDDQAERQQWLVDFFSAVFGLLDQKMRAGAGGTSWFRRIVDLSGCPGKMVSMPFVHETFEGSGIADVDCEVYDPLTCYHDFGETQPWRFTREYVTNAESARRRVVAFGRPVPEALKNLPPETPVLLSEFWVDEKDERTGKHAVTRAVLVNGTTADVKLSTMAGSPWETKFDHFPGIITATHATTISWRLPMSITATLSGTMTPYGRGITQEAMMYSSQPFWYALEQSHAQLQQFVSQMHEALAANLYPMKVYKSNDGLFHLLPETSGPGAEAALNSMNLESIEYVVNNALQAVAGMAQMALTNFDNIFNKTYNPILFGVDSPGASGYAGKGKASHALAVLEEPIQGVRGHIHDVGVEIAHQFKQSGLEMKASGYTYKGLSGRNYFLRDFKAADFPEQYVLDVVARVDVGEDEMADAQLAIQLQSAGIISRQEGRTEILDMEDNGRTQALIDAEAEADLPAIKAIKMLAKAREEIDAMFLAASKEKEPKERMTMLREANIAQAQYNQMEQQLLGQVQNASQPQAQGQPSPEAMPPEEGLNNPDQNAAAQGLVSSATGGQGARGVTGQGGGGALVGARP